MRYTIVVKKPDNLTGLTPEQIETGIVANFTEVKKFVDSLSPKAIFLQYPNYCVMGAELNDEQKELVASQPLVESINEETFMHTCCGGNMATEGSDVYVPNEPAIKTGCCGGNKCSL